MHARLSHRSRREVVLGLSLLGAFAVAGQARADGGLIISEEVSYEEVPGGTQADAALTGAVSSDGQRAVIWVREDGCWDLFVDPGEIAVSGAVWLLPLQVPPEEIAQASADFVDQLDAATLPLLLTEYIREITHYRTVYDEGGGDGFGCGFGSSDYAAAGYDEVSSNETVELDQASQSVMPPVQRWAAGRLGGVDYEVVSADDAGVLEAWLVDNGYLVPEGIGPLLAEYVAEGQVFFAARLAREHGDSTQVPVFRFTLCSTEAPSYPLRLTVLSVPSALAFTLWVVTPPYETTLAPIDADPGIFGAFYNDVVSYDYEEQEVPDFETLYLDRREALHEVFGGRGMAIEHSARLDEAAVRRRVELLGDEAEFPLSDERADWSAELRDLIEGEASHVLRLSGRFVTEAMGADIHFAPGLVEVDSGVYERSVVEVLEVWDSVDDGAGGGEAEDPEPLFEDASCRVQPRAPGDERTLPIVVILCVALALCWRRAGRNRRG